MLNICYQKFISRKINKKLLRFFHKLMERGGERGGSKITFTSQSDKKRYPKTNRVCLKVISTSKK